MIDALSGLKFREIGPANMGGRVDDFAVVESDPNVVYAGFASGGVWKTINAGTTWEPIFDNEAVSTIGCVAIAPSDPSIVWVGTGEVNNRQSSSWGNGVYKSTDAGRTWKHMGLAETHNIGSVVVHPADPNVVYVAALGRLWGPNKERGVYKTADGGATWKQVLFVNEDTGVVDLVADPESPDTLYAAAYQRRRTVFGFNGSGPGSGIYKTTDGGATWTKLDQRPALGERDGERDGPDRAGRLPRQPAIVYALVEHANGGIFRSEDRGETWTKMSATNPRPMYYSKVRIDPNNDLRIWVLGAPMFYSEDGGRTFVTTRVRRIHGDYHAMWIDPKDSRQHDRRLGRRDPLELGRRENLGLRQHHPRRPVLRGRLRHAPALPHLRRPPGQRDVGRPEPDPRPRRHHQRGLDERRRGRRILRPGRSRRSGHRLLRIAGRLSLPPRPPDDRERSSFRPISRKGEHVPLPVEFALSSSAPTIRRRLYYGGPVPLPERPTAATPGRRSAPT